MCVAFFSAVIFLNIFLGMHVRSPCKLPVVSSGGSGGGGGSAAATAAACGQTERHNGSILPTVCS